MSRWASRNWHPVAGYPCWVSLLGIQKLGLQKLGLQKLGLQKLGLQKLGLQKLGLQKLGLQKLGLQKLGLQKLGLQTLKSFRILRSVRPGDSLEIPWVSRNSCNLCLTS